MVIHLQTSTIKVIYIAYLIISKLIKMFKDEEINSV